MVLIAELEGGSPLSTHRISILERFEGVAEHIFVGDILDVLIHAEYVLAFLGFFRSSYIVSPFVEIFDKVLMVPHTSYARRYVLTRVEHMCFIVDFQE